MINTTIKSGTNSFHGSAFEFLRNSALDANNFFNNRSPTEPAAVPAEPVWGYSGRSGDNRLFFFGSYQGTRIAQGVTAVTTAPLESEKQGQFSQTVFDPATTRTEAGSPTRDPCPGNRVPSNRFDPVGAKMAALYPAPNLAGRANNFILNPGNRTNADQYDTRFDLNLRSGDTLFGCYSLTDSVGIAPGTLPPPAVGSSNGAETPTTGHSAVLSETHTFTPRMINEFRIGFNRLETARLTAVRERLIEQYGFKGNPVLFAGDRIADCRGHRLRTAGRGRDSA